MTAIVSLAPAIGASDKETAIAVANVVAFGLAGMLTYPYLAHACLDSPGAVGMFLGTAVHDTSQVVGAALTYSQLYCEPAVVKVSGGATCWRSSCPAGLFMWGDLGWPGSSLAWRGGAAWRGVAGRDGERRGVA